MSYLQDTFAFLIAAYFILIRCIVSANAYILVIFNVPCLQVVECDSILHEMNAFFKKNLQAFSRCLQNDPICRQSHEQKATKHEVNSWRNGKDGDI